FFEDLASFIPKDQEAPPIAPTMTAAPLDVAPVAADLEKEDAEEIRKVLNVQAAAILNSGLSDKERYRRYEAFCKQYDEAIYRAWSIRTEAPRNLLLGYKLVE